MKGQSTMKQTAVQLTKDFELEVEEKLSAIDERLSLMV
jgi:hypothetical protein